MKMYQLIEWFQLAYPELRNDLLNCNHNFDDEDLNPYHYESDCWSHTMMVCKIAELNGYSNIVQIAALLHDIGKPSSRKINPNNNHVQFFGHEELSALMSRDILSHMLEEEMITVDEKNEIGELISLHAVLHKEMSIKELSSLFAHRKNFYVHLVQLSRCDGLGRYSSESIRNTDRRYDRLLSYVDQL